MSCTDLIGLIVSGDGSFLVRDAEQIGVTAQLLGVSLVLLAFDSSVLDWRASPIMSSLSTAAAMLSEHGVRLAIEFIPYTALATIGDALELCGQLGWDQAGLCIDSLHTVTGSQLEPLRALDADQIALVQIADAQWLDAQLHPQDVGRYRRRLPGDGDVPLGAFTEVIRELGYRGVVSPQILSDDVANGRAIRDLVADKREVHVRALTVVNGHKPGWACGENSRNIPSADCDSEALSRVKAEMDVPECDSVIKCLSWEDAFGSFQAGTGLRSEVPGFERQDLPCRGHHL